MKPLISIVLPCYNEEENVEPLYARIVAAIEPLRSRYRFELMFVDNASLDGTVAEGKALCARDPQVRLIVNARNFGHLRSPFHGMMQSAGDAVIGMATDLQDPPELLPGFIQAWEEGASVVAGVYRKPPDQGLLAVCRNAYYRIMTAVSEAQPIPAFTGFGLYDRRVVELLRRVGGPYPYVRGLVSEFGLPIRLIPFDKPMRTAGLTKNNYLTLLDLSLLGLTSMSRAPIRVATLAGAALSALGFLLALVYLVAKLAFWNQFPLGQAPLLIGIFLFGSVQILISGLVGEYIASLHQRAQNQPHVVELYRVNFGPGDDSVADPALGGVRQAAAPVTPQP